MSVVKQFNDFIFFIILGIIISCILICLFGLLMVYSSSTIWAEYKFNDSYKYLKTQFLFLTSRVNIKK